MLTKTNDCPVVGTQVHSGEWAECEDYQDAERSHLGFTQCSESRGKGQWPPPISVNDGELVLDDTWIVAGLNRHNSLDDFLVLALVLVVVELAVYDALGRFVRRLVNDHQPAGDYRTTWDGQDDSGLAVASGVYLLRLRTGGSLQTRRLTLLK